MDLSLPCHIKKAPGFVWLCVFAMFDICDIRAKKNKHLGPLAALPLARPTIVSSKLLRSAYITIKYHLLYANIPKILVIKLSNVVLNQTATNTKI